MNDSSRETSDAASTATPGDTREALVTSARLLFAEKGYDGTSIRAITGAARANLGAVTYHFGSKAALYHEVLRRAVDPLRERIQTELEGPGTPMDRATRVVDAYLAHFIDHPDLPRFLLQQVASGQTPPPPVMDAMRGIAGAVSAVIVQGQQAGEIRDGDPLLFVLSLISQPIYLALVQRPLAHVLGMDLSSPDAREGVRRHLLSFARAGLAAEPT